MKPYIFSFAIGIGVGMVYALVKVRSPAPPAVALIGLLGMLIGEQLPTYLREITGSRWTQAASEKNEHAATHPNGSLMLPHQRDDENDRGSER